MRIFRTIKISGKREWNRGHGEKVRSPIRGYIEKQSYNTTARQKILFFCSAGQSNVVTGIFFKEKTVLCLSHAVHTSLLIFRCFIGSNVAIENVNDTIGMFGNMLFMCDENNGISHLMKFLNYLHDFLPGF